jgi:hypothetical protein
VIQCLEPCVWTIERGYFHLLHCELPHEKRLADRLSENLECSENIKLVQTRTRICCLESKRGKRRF